MIAVIVIGAIVVIAVVGYAIAASGSSRSRSSSYSYTPPTPTYRPPVAPTYVTPITPQEIQTTLQRRLGYAWQAEQEATRRRLLDQEAKVSRRLAGAMQTYQFEELKTLHRQSYQTADLVYAQLQDARSASGSLGSAIAGSGAAAAAVRRDKAVIDSFVNQYYNDVLRLNRATGNLRDRIRDNCGTAGQSWYNELMRRREQRRREGR